VGDTFASHTSLKLLTVSLFFRFFFLVRRHLFFKQLGELPL
jgi:hypothetical protein